MQENTQVNQTVPVPAPVAEQTAEVYAPSSVEKKRAVVMYGLFGIVIMIGKKHMNVFEYFHLKQAAGWWICFIFFFIVFAVLLMLPVIKFLGIIPLLLMIIVWAVFVKQAWDGKYQAGKTGGPLAFFSGIGTWLLNLFEISPDTEKRDPDMFDPTAMVPPAQGGQQPMA